MVPFPRSPTPTLARALILALCLVPVLFLPQAAHATTVDRAPRLTIKSGEAQLKAPGADLSWTALKDGATIQYGQIIRMGKTFDGALTYPDGTSLTMKPSSVLQVIQDGLRLYRGQTWIKVVKKGSGFRCITPSAIASVRGTSFTVEVPSIARTFSDRYMREFFNPQYLLKGLKGHVITTDIGLTVLTRLMQEIPGGRVPMACKVFEGKVFVTYHAPAGTVLQSWLLTQGNKVDTVRGVDAVKEAVTEADTLAWFPRATAAVDTSTPDTTTSHTPTAPHHDPGNASGTVEVNPIRLMDQSYDGF